MDTQHIGSTSIKSICAKPIIDIVVGVVSFDRILSHNDELLENGIIYWGEDHPGQYLFVCEDSNDVVDVHIKELAKLIVE